MELTVEHFDSVIEKLEQKISTLMLLLQNSTQTKTLTMTISDVEREYGYSAYNQRLARSKGDLSYEKIGFRDITYRRSDVEQWIDKKTIKAE